MQTRIWKKYKRREDFGECPHCGAALSWIYDGESWMPCDKEPVLFTLHPTGKNTVVYRRKVYENCVIFRKGDKRFEGIMPLQGNMQHWYTCPVLKEQRKMYVLEQRHGKY